MNENLRKFGWFSLSTVPLALCLIMQVVIGTIGMAVYAMFQTFKDQVASGVSETDTEIMMEVYMGYVMEGAGFSIFLYHIAGVAVFGLWYYLSCIRPKRHVPRQAKLLTMPMLGWSVASGITLCIFSTQLVKAGEYFVPRMIQDFFDLVEQAGFGADAFAIIAAIILAPVGEELLCRGVIQHYAMKASRRFWLANTIQALMFGIMHLNWVQGTYAFFIGLVLGWLRYRYKTLWVPIIIHFVVNFSTSTWLGYILDEIPRGVIIDFGILLIAIIATAVILVLVGKGEEESGGSESQPSVNYE